MDKIPKKKNIILAGDFNGRIGTQPIPECIGPYGKQAMNHTGATLRDFCAFNKLKITNSFYRHKDTQIYLRGKSVQVNNRPHNYK